MLPALTTAGFELPARGCMLAVRTLPAVGQSRTAHHGRRGGGGGGCRPVLRLGRWKSTRDRQPRSATCFGRLAEGRSSHCRSSATATSTRYLGAVDFHVELPVVSKQRRRLVQVWRCVRNRIVCGRWDLVRSGESLTSDGLSRGAGFAAHAAGRPWRSQPRFF